MKIVIYDKDQFKYTRLTVDKALAIKITKIFSKKFKNKKTEIEDF
jgi:hypothetical protein